MRSVHRIVPGEIVQTGRIEGAPFFADENFELPHDGVGDVSLANASRPNTNTGEFFICLSATMGRALNGRHVKFGTIVEGLEHVLEMGRHGHGTGAPTMLITIVSCGELEQP
jgi:cyclophilin family peptidyl-prolyl cis-trans isomerase